MKFEDLEFIEHPRIPDSVMARTEFPNGYGASVIRGPYSYGGDEGLYELAVLKGGRVCYDTEITEDVLGHLTEADVTRLLGMIESLNEDGTLPKDVLPNPGPQDHIIVRTSVYDDRDRSSGSSFFITDGDSFKKLEDGIKRTRLVPGVGETFWLDKAFVVIDSQEQLTEEQYSVFKELNMLHAGWPVYDDLMWAVLEKEKQQKEKPQ